MDETRHGKDPKKHGPGKPAPKKDKPGPDDPKPTLPEGGATTLGVDDEDEEKDEPP